MTLLGRMAFAFALGAILLAACDSNDAAPPPGAAGGSGSTQAGADNRPTAGDSGSELAGAGGVAGPGEGGASGYTPPFGSIGGEFPEAAGGAPPNPAPRCDPNAEWGNPVGLASLNTPQADERLLGMTWDELTLVFARGTELFVADRADATQDFPAPLAVALPDGYTFEHGLALSANGLTLVLVRQDQLGFADVKRSARGKTFEGSPSTARFGLVNGVLTQSGGVAWPALSSDGKWLVLTRLEGVDQTGFRISGEKFDQPERLDSVTFGAVDGEHKLSHSLSSDARTLFFFDEGVGHAAALGTSTPRAAYNERIELPGLQSAFSSESCERLYGSLEVDGSLDLVFESLN